MFASGQSTTRSAILMSTIDRINSTFAMREIIDFPKELKVILGELGQAGSFELLYSFLNAHKGELGVINTFFMDEGQGIFDRPQTLLPDLLL